MTSLRLIYAKSIISYSYLDIDGFKIFREAQEKRKNYDISHIYGEIDIESFAAILSSAQPKEGEVFYDLGSGTGKAIVAASLLFPFSQTIGIEELPELYDISVLVSKKFKKTVHFINENINDYDFSDGDIIFRNAHYSQRELYHPEFLKTLSQLKIGSRLISVRAPIDSPFLQIMSVDNRQFSWGSAKVFTSRKVK